MAAPGRNLIVRDLGEETIVYDLRTHRAHCLGQTAAAIWRAWDGRNGSAETARRVSRVLAEPVDEASVRLVWRRLRRAGLLGDSVRQVESDGRAVAAPVRRRLISALGVAAGLMVLSMATRSSAQAAATCLHNGTRCAHSSQCCGHCCNVHSGRCSGGGDCVP